VAQARTKFLGHQIVAVQNPWDGAKLYIDGEVSEARFLQRRLTFDMTKGRRRTMATCPICKAEVGELDPEHLVVGFICPTHGRFRVSRAALAMPRLMNAPRDQWEAALKRAKAYAPSDVWAACSRITGSGAR
jgi:hypothetical protein